MAKCAILGCCWRAAKEVEELFELKRLECRKIGRLSCVSRISSNCHKPRENFFSLTSLPSLITEERMVDVVTV